MTIPNIATFDHGSYAYYKDPQWSNKNRIFSCERRRGLRFGLTSGWEIAIWVPTEVLQRAGVEVLDLMVVKVVQVVTPYKKKSSSWVAGFRSLVLICFFSQFWNEIGKEMSWEVCLWPCGWRLFWHLLPDQCDEPKRRLEPYGLHWSMWVLNQPNIGVGVFPQNGWWK